MTPSSVTNSETITLLVETSLRSISFYTLTTNGLLRIFSRSRMRSPDWGISIAYSWGLPGSEKEDIAYRVPIDWTACNFGGGRPWFLCLDGAAAGDRPCSTWGGYFLCRSCQDLSSASQRERNSSVPALHRCRRIRTKLGGSPNIREPFPDKPKGMHWKTYWRLYERHEVAWEQYAGALAVEMERMRAQLDAIADRGR